MNKRDILIAFLILVLVTSACQEANTTGIPDIGVDPAYPNESLLVSVEWLVGRLDDPDIRIIDTRQANDYNMAHIPQAVNLPVSEIVATVEGVPFIYEEGRVQEAVNRSGLTPEMTAIIYDDLGMLDSARLFWTLEYIGHHDVRILNGGWNAWVAGEMPIEDIQTQFEPVQYPINADPAKIVNADQVLAKMENPDVVIVDARSPQEYAGEVALADRAGRIPGSVNLVWLDTLTGGDVVYTIEPEWREVLQDEDVEVFKSAEEIQTILGDLYITPEKEIITYCQTLWRGAHVYFLLRLMGFENVRGYDGSWAEWGNRVDLPIEVDESVGGASKLTLFTK